MSNTMRLVFLSLAPLALLVIIGYLLAGVLGSFVALVFFGMFTFVSYFFSEKIIVDMYCARPADEKKDKAYYDLVKRLAEVAEIAVPKLYVVDTCTPTSLTFGRDSKHASVAVTTGLLQLCDDREIEAVISHELAHIANDDISLRTFSAILSVAVLYPFELLWWKSVNAGGKAESLLRLPALLVAPFAAIMVRLAVSSSVEVAADVSASKISGKPKCLALVLEKISREVKFRPLKFGSHAMSHLFIMNPFNGTALSRFFTSRFHVKDRIQRLEKMTA